MPIPIVERVIADLKPSGDRGESFAQYAQRLTIRLGQAMAVTLLVVCPLTWPSDFVIYHDQEVVLQQFFIWRVGIIALSVLALLGLRFVPSLRRHPALWFGIIICAGSALCSGAVSKIGGLNYPFYYCGYSIALMTIPIIIPPRARLALVTALVLSYGAGFFGLHPEYLLQTQLSFPVFIFHSFIAMICVGVGHVVYHLLKDNHAQRLMLHQRALALDEAKKQSEELLLNILPAQIAQQLKDGQTVIVEAHDDVSVLFADICGFTTLSSHLPPQRILQMLNEIFSIFDTLAEKYGLEKIKTIGDAYMVASGLPDPDPDQARDIADMALAMRTEASRVIDPNGDALLLRIGIHTGPVVAGVIGHKKFIYDLWGDTVNVASRMESHGLPGKIQITHPLRRLLGDNYLCEPRGEIVVKGKGSMSTFFLEGHAAPQDSSDGYGDGYGRP